MDIHLNQIEIYTAIEEYISNQGIDLSQKQTDISLTAGRGPKGHYADIAISNKGEGKVNPFTADDAVEDKPDSDEDTQALEFD